jgi:hypothetical protein
VQTEQAVKSEKEAWEQTKPEEGADSKARRCVGRWRMGLRVLQWGCLSCLCRVDLLTLCACAAARVTCMEGMPPYLPGIVIVGCLLVQHSTAQHRDGPTASAWD